MRKKVFALLAGSALLFVACNKAAPVTTDESSSSSMVAEDGTGDDTMMATDTWAEASDGMWQDADGKWMKLVDGKLQWSEDGTTWAEVSTGMWKAPDGNWYKWDTAGALQMSSDNGQSWVAAESWAGSDDTWYMMADGVLMMKKGAGMEDDTQADAMMEDGQ